MSERQEHYDLAEMTEENRSSQLKPRESQAMGFAVWRSVSN